MAINTDKFMAKFKGGARPNLYRIECPILPSEFAILCKTSQLPGADVGVIDKKFLGKQLKIKGDITYPDLSVTLELDVNDPVRTALELWLADPSLKATISVFQLDKDGNDIMHYEYLYAWPSSMAAIEQGQDSSDTISEYTVTFPYNEWLRIK